MKKAQVTNQVFVYILTILIIGLLLFFGMKWIGDLLRQGEIIDETKFVIDIENAFAQIQYGDGKNHDFLVPAEVDVVCFVDSSLPRSEIKLRNLCIPESDIYDPLICNSWQDNTSSVLFSPPLKTEISVGDVRIDDPQKFLCFSTISNNWVKVRLVGLGNRVKVSAQ